MGIKWSWKDFPIGVPLDEGDEDFEGDRSAPLVSLCLEYVGENVTFRQAVMRPGQSCDLPEIERVHMQRLLLEWLDNEIKNFGAARRLEQMEQNKDPKYSIKDGEGDDSSLPSSYEGIRFMKSPVIK